MGIREEKMVSAGYGNRLGLAPPPAAASRRATAADRWLARKLLEAVGEAPVAMELWDGTEVALPGRRPEYRVRVGDRRALWSLLLDPEVNFGDLFSAGRVRLEGDLVSFIETAYTALERAGGGPWGRPGRWLGGRRRRNTLRGSRDNIHHHYDIGNDFYALWLDSAHMQYTCAYFPDPAISLEAAQEAKLHHVCRKLQLRPGETVVEAGCGWGGLARFMARHYGVTVRAYNISEEQVKYARERARAEGLAGRVEYVLDDYRNIEGTYDVFVSVGMLEHVGPDNYRQLGEVIARSMRPDGRGLIHTIGRRSPAPMNGWIERRIFPGAHPPSLAEMMEIFEPQGFAVQDVENLRLHYALTLRHWLDRFEAHAGEVREMFDEAFVRAWRLYLAGSIAAFRTSQLQLFQVLFTGPDRHDLPWSRAHLYDAGAAA